MALGEMVPWRWGSLRRSGRDDRALEGFRGDIVSLHREMDRLFGVLTISLPKTREVQNKVKHIEVKAA